MSEQVLPKVYFTDLHTRPGRSLEDKFNDLLTRSEWKQSLKPGEMTAVKIHTGERGNLGYVSHNYARLAAQAVKDQGGLPYLTDTNTLYSGGRHNGIDHAVTAIQHGFTYASTGAPFLPADGVRGHEFEEIPTLGRRIKKAKLASGILKSERIIFLSHFKAHIGAGFGGTLKHMGMGCASISGKMEQHSDSKPEIDRQACTACGICVRACPEKAILMDKKAEIDLSKCIGCGQCVAVCNYSAVQIQWDSDKDVFIEKIADYASAVRNHFKDRAFYVNFALNITPDCDCWGNNDLPVVHDVGIFASHSPLALEQATWDMVNRSPVNEASEYADQLRDRKDIFQALRPHISSARILDYCEELGMERRYQLKKV